MSWIPITLLIISYKVLVEVLACDLEFFLKRFSRQNNLVSLKIDSL